MKFLEPTTPMQLAIYVDAAHATDLTTRRSISGMVASLNETAIAYKRNFNQQRPIALLKLNSLLLFLQRRCEKSYDISIIYWISTFINQQ